MFYGNELFVLYFVMFVMFWIFVIWGRKYIIILCIFIYIMVVYWKLYFCSELRWVLLKVFLGLFGEGSKNEDWINL